MGDNAGVDMLKMLVKMALFILKLLPRLIMLIIKAVVAIVNMFKKKEDIEEAPAE